MLLLSGAYFGASLNLQSPIKNQKWIKVSIFNLTEGKSTTMRKRGTAVVVRDGKFLLVRDRGKKQYSLPGGGAHRKEPSMAAAIRELYEELEMSAKKSERILGCDYKGALNTHGVSLIETDDEPRLRGKELDEFIWWDMKLDIPRYPHVDHILNKIKLHLQLE